MTFFDWLDKNLVDAIVGFAIVVWILTQAVCSVIEEKKDNK